MNDLQWHEYHRVLIEVFPVRKRLYVVKILIAEAGNNLGNAGGAPGKLEHCYLEGVALDHLDAGASLCAILRTNQAGHAEHTLRTLASHDHEMFH